MSFETQKDYFRFAPNFKTSLVKQVLPEHFAEDYPAHISFLEGYYEFLDSDDNFGGAINELLQELNLINQSINGALVFSNGFPLSETACKFLKLHTSKDVRVTLNN